METNEKIKIYKKTPLIRTAAVSSLLYESYNMFYHFITKNTPMKSYLDNNINFITKDVASVLTNLGNYAYANKGLSFAITTGVTLGLYFMEKGRDYIPKNVKIDSYKKYYFLEDKIKYYTNKYVQPLIYGCLGTGVAVTGAIGTYGSFVKGSLNLFKNFPQVAENYSTLLLVVGSGLGYASSKKLAEYVSTFGRGVYEKYLLFNSFMKNKNEEKEEKEVKEKVEEEKINASDFFNGLKTEEKVEVKVENEVKKIVYNEAPEGEKDVKLKQFQKLLGEKLKKAPNTENKQTINNNK